MDIKQLNMQCPACGVSLDLHIAQLKLGVAPSPVPPAGRHTFGSDVKLRESVPWSPPAAPLTWPADVQEAERTMPARPASMESDVWVPLSWSLISGGTLAVSASAVGLWLGWPLASVPYVAPLAFSVGFGAVWAWRLAAHSELLWLTDWFDRGAAAPDAPPPQRLQIEITTDKQRMDIIEPPAGVSERSLRLFARAALAGQTLAVNAWTGKGKPFTQAQYNDLMAELERAGLVANHGGNVGRKPTAAGMQAFKQIVDLLA